MVSATDWKPRGDTTHAKTPYPCFKGKRKKDAHRELRKERDRARRKKGYRRCDAVSVGISSDDEVVTVWRCDGGGGETVGRRRRESPEIPCMESREGTGQPDRAASLVGCTEGRQLPAGLPPPRLYVTRERERESRSMRHFERGDRGGTARAREKSRGESVERPPCCRPVSLTVKSARLKRPDCVKPKSCGRDGVMRRPFSISVGRLI